MKLISTYKLKERRATQIIIENEETEAKYFVTLYNDFSGLEIPDIKNITTLNDIINTLLKSKDYLFKNCQIDITKYL